MYSFALAQTGAADTAWAQSRAVAALRSAVEALDDVRASLAVLTADTDWHSDGVRAMQHSLDDLRRRTRVEASEMRSRESEAERIDVS
ncbi:hypothetical protein BMW26_16810 [Microbacterium sp. 1.5R]|uniref:hypothetical protein n=1 Tax=Microbacterium TaxID=33882 RepID=UPI00090CA964|nr:MULTISPECIES: hypothetical protein [unclassified Microbacterium]APH46416.1 hypothetical protein BMW26_16810 [Microbacterium sp. 1.5R]MBC6493868.1 hypothetical protein [Microbacterium sp. 4-7]MDY0983667.1 hypothetical protein [Microbacterium sp. CFBP9023]CAH0217201.1 hypothetical protein SRABI98_02398 [Microbacterium sp. Bi98]